MNWGVFLLVLGLGLISICLMWGFVRLVDYLYEEFEVPAPVTIMVTITFVAAIIMGVAL